MTSPYRLASILALAVLAGCSTTPMPNISTTLLDTTGQDGRACVDTSDIRGYGVLEQDVISIDARNNYYLATVLPGCNNLEVSARAMFSSRFYEVCGGGMDHVRTGGDNCTIRNMFEFENREEAFAAHDAAIAARKAAAEQAE